MTRFGLVAKSELENLLKEKQEMNHYDISTRTLKRKKANLKMRFVLSDFHQGLSLCYWSPLMASAISATIQLASALIFKK